jgi:hypothetical protein
MSGNPDNEDTNEHDDDRTAIVVGLIATPPDYPARVVQRLADELADLLARRVNDGARWEVRTGWGSVGYHPDPGGWLHETGGSNGEGPDRPGLPEGGELPRG